MNFENFIVVGENMHCTRMVKRGGIKMTELPGGEEAITFKYKGEDRLLMVPGNWAEVSPDYDKGKCKHVALAIYLALNGGDEDQQTGKDYLCYVADRQIEKGTTFLDVNVDEYSSDSDATVEIMNWLTTFLSKRYETPLSIDSSHPKSLAIGLANCRTDIGPAMVNSISLERPEAIDIVKQYNAESIVNAAGHSDLPTTVDGRLTTFREILGLIHTAAKANDPSVNVSSSHRRLIQFERHSTVPTVLNHWRFVQGELVYEIKLGFARVPAREFYTAAFARLKAAGVEVPEPRFIMADKRDVSR